MAFVYVLAALVLVSCSSAPRLIMPASRAPIDQSAISPETHSGQFRRVFVIPPKNITRYQYDSILLVFEREFLRKGIKVIPAPYPKKTAANENAPEWESTEYSEIAKRHSADAMLQIHDWSWSKEALPSRFFKMDSGSEEKRFIEVTESEYHSTPGPKYAFSSSEFRLMGRLLNVANGEILGSFALKCPANFNLPGEYSAILQIENDKAVLDRESYTYSTSTWVEEAKRRTESMVISSIGEKLVPARQISSEKTPGPPPQLESPPSQGVPDSLSAPTSDSLSAPTPNRLAAPTSSDSLQP